MKTNNETTLIWEYLSDSLISYDNYGEPMCAGIAHIVSVESIHQMMESKPGVYEFLLDCIDLADFAHIANLVNETK